jgi:hypothetical protein
VHDVSFFLAVANCRYGLNLVLVMQLEYAFRPAENLGVSGMDDSMMLSTAQALLHHFPGGPDFFI